MKNGSILKFGKRKLSVAVNVDIVVDSTDFDEKSAFYRLRWEKLVVR